MVLGALGGKGLGLGRGTGEGWAYFLGGRSWRGEVMLELELLLKAEGLFGFEARHLPLQARELGVRWGWRCLSEGGARELGGVGDDAEAAGRFTCGSASLPYIGD